MKINVTSSFNLQICISSLRYLNNVLRGFRYTQGCKFSFTTQCDKFGFSKFLAMKFGNFHIVYVWTPNFILNSIIHVYSHNAFIFSSFLEFFFGAINICFPRVSPHFGT